MQYVEIFHVFSEDDILPFSEVKFFMLFGWQILCFDRASMGKMHAYVQTVARGGAIISDL